MSKKPAPFRRQLGQPVLRKSPPKVQQEVIVIDDSSEEESPKRPEPPPRPVKSPLKDDEPIQISSSDAEPDPPTRSKPVAAAPVATPHQFKRTSAFASSSRLRLATPTSSQLAQLATPTRPRPRPRPVARKPNVPTHLEDFPPLPPSSDAKSSSPPEENPISSPVRNPTAYRDQSAVPNPSSDADADSSSSGEMVETEILPDQQQLPGVILDSSSAGSSDENRGRSVTVPREATVPREQGHITSPSSPSHASDQTEAEAQEDLEESIANVSLYGNLGNKGKAPDSAVAQAAAAVMNFNIGPGSDAAGLASGSEASEERFNCSVGDCHASFATAGQLHSHTSRDHGIKLSFQKKLGRGKRKARDASISLPSKRRTTGLPLEPRSRDSSASGGSASASGSHASDRYVQRTHTVGFEPFMQKVSDQESLSPSDVPDVVDVSSGSSKSPSPPSTPAPSIPKMRAPHPNIRTSIPERPLANLSPSKQIAQNKDEILIPGEELETWRVDLVNSMPESFRKNYGCRAVFEAYMDDAMRENEPCAPPIAVENEVDNEPCPPWEFVYYNRMVYGANVPKPDLDALQGCDCLGPCNPSNKNCACVQRQERYYAENPGLDEYEGFGFHGDGIIKYHSGAIFGCNSKCSCDADCPNKVLQQGRKYAISIKKTKNKGWGVFAKESIPPGKFIGVYTGELLTEGIVGKRSPVYDEFGRTYVLNIDFAHIRANKDAPTYAVDAFHAGNFTRFFNHSCQPNLFLTAYYCDDVDIQKPLLTLFCDRDIKAGEELTFSYTGLDVDDPADVAKLERLRREENSGKVFEKCLCGAPKCFGIIFTGEG